MIHHAEPQSYSNYLRWMDGMVHLHLRSTRCGNRLLRLSPHKFQLDPFFTIAFTTYHITIYVQKADFVL